MPGNCTRALLTPRACTTLILHPAERLIAFFFFYFLQTPGSDSQFFSVYFYKLEIEILSSFGGDI